VHHERGARVALDIGDADREFNVDGEVIELGELSFSVLGQIRVVVAR
jgi:hypothetical protein